MLDKVAKHRWDKVKYRVGSIDIDVANVVDALAIYRNLVGIVK
jgi:hypothetical protein